MYKKCIEFLFGFEFLSTYVIIIPDQRICVEAWHALWQGNLAAELEMDYSGILSTPHVIKYHLNSYD